MKQQRPRSRFPAVLNSLQVALRKDSIVDGELDPEGRPTFSLIQNAGRNQAPIVFYGFDLLALAGQDLTGRPLSEGRALLREHLKLSETVQLSETFQVSAEKMVQLVRTHGLEGVVAKHLSSTYEEGSRSRAWPVRRRRRTVGALLYPERMAIIQPTASAALRDELTKADAVHRFALETITAGTFSSNGMRFTIFGAYVHLSTDLHWSIISLLALGGPSDGGAFALVRPFIEAVVMAQWLYFCAPDELVERAFKGEQVSPGLPNMMGAIDKAAGEGGIYGADMRSKVKVLHGFTHGGIEQLGRRVDSEGNYKANYADTEKAEVLRETTRNFAVICGLFCKIISDDPTADPRSSSIHSKFAEIYGNPG